MKLHTIQGHLVLIKFYTALYLGLHPWGLNLILILDKMAGQVRIFATVPLAWASSGRLHYKQIDAEEKPYCNELLQSENAKRLDLTAETQDFAHARRMALQAPEVGKSDDAPQRCYTRWNITHKRSRI